MEQQHNAQNNPVLFYSLEHDVNHRALNYTLHMNKAFDNILAGFGSVLAIMPTTDYMRFVPKQTPYQRMQSHFEHVGSSFHRAIGRWENEQKKT